MLFCCTQCEGQLRSWRLLPSPRGNETQILGQQFRLVFLFLR